MLGHLRGIDLISDGLQIMAAPESAAQVLVLEPRSAAEGAKFNASTAVKLR